MTFEKVRPRKVTAIAAEQVVEAIQRGDYPVGSKLPSEFELAEQMGVSRPSIREALSALQAMEIIESRPEAAITSSACRHRLRSRTRYCSSRARPAAAR